MASDSTPPAVRQLCKLAQYSDRLPSLIEISKGVPPAIKLKSVTAQIADQSGMVPRDVTDIFFAIDQIRSMAENLGHIDTAIDRLIEWYGADLGPFIEKRNQIVAALAAVDDDNPAEISLKARKLAYMRQQLLTDVEIITDARPVYDSRAQKILKYVITHTLVITHQKYGQGNERIHFAIDSDDLVKIQKQCERATLKARTLREALGENAEVLGEDARAL